MFRIGILEAASTCRIIVLPSVIPLVVARSQAPLGKRLKRIENKREKKK